MATTEPIQRRSFHPGHYLAIAGIALALVVGAFVVDAVASIGVLTRGVGMETPYPDPPPQGGRELKELNKKTHV